ncbi:hypothetical protein BT96DRAFT_1001336 [Gymnopus androsaceus JB14]|uniref:Uncharacterized protein n=1 Tax=Gymnopus androsaceus JB14 TaxID=1447944 RepID=A0A6A4H111_9AGAR|nr:hypothetical protein BT96DRAFT_1001336 [Gymnopus androsaceus JB14]
MPESSFRLSFPTLIIVTAPPSAAALTAPSLPDAGSSITYSFSPSKRVFDMGPALPLVLVEKECVAYKSIPAYLQYNPDWASLVDCRINVPCWLPHCIAKYKYKYQIEQIVGERAKSGTTQFLIRDTINVPPAAPTLTLVNNDIWREGWALLKRYFEDDKEVPAGKVDEFLNKIDNSIEAQLHPVFGRIMGLDLENRRHRGSW